MDGPSKRSLGRVLPAKIFWPKVPHLFIGSICSLTFQTQQVYTKFPGFFRRWRNRGRSRFIPTGGAHVRSESGSPLISKVHLHAFATSRTFFRAELFSSTGRWNLSYIYCNLMLGLDYEYKAVDIFKGEQFDPG